MLLKNKIDLYLGNNKSGKTTELQNVVFQSLLDKNTNVLVVVRNSFSEHKFRESKFDNFHNIKIIRFRALVKSIVNNYFYLLHTNKEPNFIGFSETIYLLKEFLSKNNSFINTQDKNIIQKIFDRMQRKADNNLPILDNEYKNSILNNIDLFIKNFYEHLLSKEKVFLDYSLQLRLLHEILNKEEFINTFVRNISLIVVDDIHEAIYSEQLFFEKLKEFLPKTIYSGNPIGGIRRYWGANPEYISYLQKQDYVKTIKLSDNETLKFYKHAKHLYKVLSSKSETYEPLNLNKEDINLEKSIDYGTMLDLLSENLFNLKENNYSASEIEIIVPEFTDIIINQVKNSVSKVGWDVDYDSNSFMLIKNIRIKNLITILRIVFYSELKNKTNTPLLNSMDYSALIYIVGNSDPIIVSKLRNRFGNNSKSYLDFIDSYSKKEGYSTFKKIQNAIDFAKINKETLYKKEDFLNYLIEIDKMIKGTSNDFIRELEIFLDMVKNFLDINLNDENINNQNILPLLISSIVSGELSDNPDVYREHKSNRIVLSTKQKSSEISNLVKVQIWLDSTSHKWIEKNINDISNPYILAPYFNKKDKEWSYKDEIFYQELDLAVSLKRLLSACSDKLYILSCDYNSTGDLNNFNFINDFFQDL